MRVAILVGQGARGAGAEIAEVVDLLGAGVAKALLGKDVLSDELPYVTGERAYPPPDPSVGGGLMARMSRLYPRHPIDLGPRVRAITPPRSKR